MTTTQTFDMDAFMNTVAASPRQTYEQISANQLDLNRKGLLETGKGVQYDAVVQVGTTEVAKLIRQLLKRTFVGFKFSVRTERYAGGSSIHIGYSQQFEALPGGVSLLNSLVKGFQSKRFDGMTDSSSYAYSWLLPDGSSVPAYCAAFGTNPEEDHPNPGGATLVSFGAGYVFAQRSY